MKRIEPKAPSTKPVARKAQEAEAERPAKAKPAARPPKRPVQEPVKEPGPVGRAVRRVFRAAVAWVFGFIWRAALVGGLILAGATGYYYSTLPPVDALFDGRSTGSVTLLDRTDTVFAWRGEQFGGELRAEEVSPHLIHAVIAAEDRRYWGHHGIDPRGIARAMWVNLRAGEIVQGGSTLTQQVAKNVFLSHERSIERKLKEMPMALALELKYSKRDILSIYLNRVYLGAGTYGFEAASQRYFGKSARGLGPAEAAMLAGLLRAPSTYAPTNDIGRAQGRASVIVRAMHEEGYLSDAQVFEALANPAGLSDAAEAEAGGDFADWVMETAPQYLARRTTEDVIIATTFDAKAQAAVEEAVAHVFESKVKPSSVAQVGVVVLEPDGAVRAMFGGRGERGGRFNRATQAKRQTGSAFKPVIYAAALEAGFAPRDTIEDAPLTIGSWSPENYGGGYRGTVTLEEALARSINTVAVRLSERVGRERVRALATRLGIATEIDEGPALALGTSETTLVDMAAVYGTIAAEGRRVSPYGLRQVRLRDDEAAILRHRAGPGERVISGETARRLTHMMHAVVMRGTGGRARLEGWQVAGKTGTTQAARDAWFIGFTADYVIGVWMGNDDNTPLTGVTGGGLPAEIWREVAVRLHAGRTPRPLQMEAGPAPVGLPAPGRGADPANETLVERIYSDVVRSLSADPGTDPPSRPSDELFVQPGNDR
ncbi:MAG: transglycosylase domain-containing protein [Paracoccaceae bacterium]